MSLFWYASALIAKLLQVILIGVMQRRGYYRFYPFLFAYSVLTFLAGVVEWAAVLKFYSTASPAYATYYWTADLGLQFLLYLTMASLIYRSLEGEPRRLLLSAGMTAAVILACAGVAFFDSAPRASMPLALTLLSRNLGFGAALLNLVLWWALLKSRARDHQMLLLSAGIGLMTTGRAMGHALRSLDKSLQTTGNIVVVYTALLCFALWAWTFIRIPVRDRLQAGGPVAGTPRGAL